MFFFRETLYPVAYTRFYKASKICEATLETMVTVFHFITPNQSWKSYLHLCLVYLWITLKHYFYFPRTPELKKLCYQLNSPLLPFSALTTKSVSFSSQYRKHFPIYLFPFSCFIRNKNLFAPPKSSPRTLMHTNLQT